MFGTSTVYTIKITTVILMFNESVIEYIWPRNKMSFERTKTETGQPIMTTDVKNVVGNNCFRVITTTVYIY